MSSILLHEALSCRGSHGLKNFQGGMTFFLFQNVGHLLHFLILPAKSFVSSVFSSLHAFFSPIHMPLGALYRAPPAKASSRKL